MENPSIKSQIRQNPKPINPSDVSDRAIETTNTNPRVVTPICLAKVEILVTCGGQRLKESVMFTKPS